MKIRRGYELIASRLETVVMGHQTTLQSGVVRSGTASEPPVLNPATQARVLRSSKVGRRVDNGVASCLHRTKLYLPEGVYRHICLRPCLIMLRFSLTAPAKEAGHIFPARPQHSICILYSLQSFIENITCSKRRRWPSRSADHAGF